MMPNAHGSAHGGIKSGRRPGVRRTTAMRLRMGVLGVTVATMFVIFPNVGPPVLASDATDQLRTAIEQMYRLVATGSTAETREAVRKAADRMFDWAAMAEGALGQH
jgi:hypothetical protein